MQYIVSEPISTMEGLHIPVFNLDEYFDVTEGYNGRDTTIGSIKLSYYFMNASIQVKSERKDELKNKMVVCVNENDNKVNVRLSTNSDVVKYILAFKWGGQSFVVSNVNEKTTKVEGVTGYGNYEYSTYAVNSSKICLMYHDSPNGKRYYYFMPLHQDNSFPMGSIYLTCWDDFASIDIQEKSEEYGDYSSSGGYGGGSFDDSSDAFGLPSLPSLGVSEAGFVNVYKPTSGQLVGFADELFPDFEMPTPSTKEGIDGVVENLNNVASVLGFFADSYLNKGLIDYVIDCHIVPVAPSITSNTGIKVGYKTFNYNPSKVTSDYVEFDCGTLQIAEYYQNFLDYEGTRAKLYAPFIGFVDIKPEWFQSGSLRLVYHFNIIDGSCIAFVIATSSKSKLSNTVVATFGGNCCVHMPITGLNYSSMISGVLGGASKVLSGQIAGGAEQIATARPSIEQSNGYNAGMSFMCYRRPYLLIERPVASFSKDYPREQGLPLNVTKKLSSLKGFTTCTAPIIDNFHCLEEEKEMIKQALIEGTIF